MTPEQIAELERLEREACTAPWRVPVANVFRVVVEGAPPWRVVCDFDPGDTDDTAHHAAVSAMLASEARNALPSLLSSARDLAALRAGVEALAGEWRSGWGSAQTALARQSIEHADRLLVLLPGGDADREGGR